MRELRVAGIGGSAHGGSVPASRRAAQRATVHAVRQLLPHPAEDIDLYEAYRPDGPLVRLNMVMSADGAVTDSRGRAGGLGGAGDREVFRTLRAHADAIVVGAGTARTEGYGPHRLTAALAARRRADGRAAPAAIVVVSRSLLLDPAAPLFVAAETPTIVLTSRAADPERVRAVERVGRMLVAGDDEVDLPAGLAALCDAFGYAQILCEGGPLLNAGLLAHGLVDELCLTVGPLLAGDAGPRFARGLAATVDLTLTAAIEDDGELFLRYLVGKGS